MPRLFTALPIPDDVCEELSLMQGGIEGARWTVPADFHLTLAFLGEVAERDLEDLDLALSGVSSAAFEFRLSGTGSFAQGKWPNVLWMGVETGPLLGNLKDHIDRRVEAAGIAVERRRFTPHVTMARLRHADDADIAGFMQRHNLYKSRPITADHFVLYESVMGRGAGEARYVPLESYYFG
jgi:2'-5' RNA ligase